MPSVYLDSADYANYGVPSATSAQVTQASNLIDSFLQRPEGLIYVNGGNGLPCYMKNLVATNTLTTTGAITAGTNVSVNVTGPLGTPTNNPNIGLVVVLDRANPAVTEACVITFVSGNTVTFSSTQFNHDSGITIEFGLCISEQRVMPLNRPITNLFKCPVVNLLSGQGQYGFGRRNDAGNFSVNDINLLAAFTVYGGPPIWEIFPVTTASVDPATGIVWVPAGIMLSYYTEVRLYYIAGYTYATLPSQVKQACANVINNSTQTMLNPGIKSMRAGDTEIVRFNNTLLDGDTQQMLRPFRSREFI